ncbi:hypothetical protein KSP39_PZI005985 [Platanthera zijinensis]|uniref:Uncharacterized protein n=1 Tax=Platanthera zijinensis TaxID=2320716 RepID=A0AAP0BRK5_9ASPA
MRKRVCSRVQSFPTPDSKVSYPSSLLTTSDEFSAPKLTNIRYVREISAYHLSMVLDEAIDAQKMCMTLTMGSIGSTTGRNSDWNFINCYLDNTVLLLDACNNMHHRLENIQGFLRSIPIGLHCLEGEHQRSTTVLRRAAAALESSCLRDRQHSSKMEKSMSRIRTFVKKLSMTYQDTNGSISPEIYRGLSVSLAMAVLAIGNLCSATSFSAQRTGLQPQNMEAKVEMWTKLKNELSKKIKMFPKKTEEIVLMEELKVVDIAVQTLLKLTLAVQMGSGSVIRRTAVKVLLGELQSRREQLEKALPQLEQKIGELYRLIVALRMRIFGYLSEAQMEDKVGLAKSCCWRESQMGPNTARLQVARNWIIVQTNLTKRACSLGQIGSSLRLIQSAAIKPKLL